MKSEYGVGSTFTFYIKTCRTPVPEIPEQKSQIPDFDRVREELPNVFGAGIDLFEDTEAPSQLLSGLESQESDLAICEDDLIAHVS